LREQTNRGGFRALQLVEHVQRVERFLAEALSSGGLSCGLERRTPSESPSAKSIAGTVREGDL
jgi:hypothetical protein